jgi:predicted RNase H-like HicB family nuclease
MKAPRQLEVSMPGQDVRIGPDETLTEYRYTVLFEPLSEVGYNVFVPALPEICTFGEAIEEARAMAQDAIRCVLESLRKNKEPIAPDVDPARETVAVTLA